MECMMQKEIVPLCYRRMVVTRIFLVTLGGRPLLYRSRDTLFVSRGANCQKILPSYMASQHRTANAFEVKQADGQWLYGS